MNAIRAVADGPATASKRTHARYAIVAMLFLVTAINYADRATLSIAGPALSKDLGLDAVTMGYVFSAFGWSYVIGQLPGGWLLDRFGPKRVYFASIFIWSVFTMLQGGIRFLTSTAMTTVVVLFALRFLVGLAEAPSFPANGRIVAAWFPANERGTASAVFNSAQYFATVLRPEYSRWQLGNGAGRCRAVVPAVSRDGVLPGAGPNAHPSAAAHRGARRGSTPAAARSSASAPAGRTPARSPARPPSTARRTTCSSTRRRCRTPSTDRRRRSSSPASTGRSTPGSRAPAAGPGMPRRSLPDDPIDYGTSLGAGLDVVLAGAGPLTAMTKDSGRRCAAYALCTSAALSCR